VARHRTTIVPTRPAPTLLTTSAYRLSRNPMYTRLAIGYLGAAAVFGLASHETLAEAAALVTGPGRIPAAVGRRAGAAELEPRAVRRLRFPRGDAARQPRPPRGRTRLNWTAQSASSSITSWNAVPPRVPGSPGAWGRSAGAARTMTGTKQLTRSRSGRRFGCHDLLAQSAMALAEANPSARIAAAESCSVGPAPTAATRGPPRAVPSGTERTRTEELAASSWGSNRLVVEC